MNRLKELRENNDLLQKDIATILKTDQSNYSKYELEKIGIPIDLTQVLIIFYIEQIKELLIQNQ